MRFQRVPSLTIAVKFFLDKNQLTVAMTGSSSIGLLDRSADTLAGRIKIFHLLPACWGEEEGEPTHSFFTDKVEPPQLNKAKREFEQYLKFGGFPEVVSKSLAEEKEEILNNYRNTYFTRDLAQLSNIENIEGLLAILNHLVRSTGSHLEISNFARESGLTHTTAKKYINALLQSELAFKLYGYQYGPAKRYLKASKIYLADNGIITALKQEVNRGQKIEHFVISELEKRRKLGFIKADQFYYYKSTSGKEIDLLFEENDCLNIVEIKSTANLASKDFRNILTFTPKVKRKKINRYLIYTGIKYEEYQGVRCIPIYALYRAK